MFVNQKNSIIKEWKYRSREVLKAVLFCHKKQKRRQTLHSVIFNPLYTCTASASNPLFQSNAPYSIVSSMLKNISTTRPGWKNGKWTVSITTLLQDWPQGYFLYFFWPLRALSLPQNPCLFFCETCSSYYISGNFSEIYPPLPPAERRGEKLTSGYLQC